MCKRMIHLFSLVLMVSQACNAVEVARWDFEETSGTTATDQSGQYVATLTGGDTLDVDGKFGSGIDFAGDGGATVDVAGSEAFRFTEDFSIVLWVNSDVAWGAHTRFVDISNADGGLQDSYRLFTHSGDNSDNFKFMSRQDGSNTQNIHTRDMPAGTWILLALRHDLDGDVTMNVLQDGDSVDEAFVAANSESWPTAGSIVYAAGELKFGRLIGTTRKFEGKMDAVAFYDEVLTDDQVAAMFYAAGSSEHPLAAGPDPADGASLEATWGNLGWRAGDYAISHDLYFGTSFDDVNDGAEGTFAGNLATTRQVIGFAGFPAPDGLQPGTTYYWRVDEVNDANVASPWKGDVWSFSIPPQTAYNNSPADGASNVLQDVTLNWTPGMGASLHHVYFGESLDEVSNAAGAIPQVDAIFAPATLEAEKTYYWRVDEFDNTGTTYRGDVWSFTTVPDIAVADPDLQGWWTLDEGDGTTAVDWSGHGGHGGFVGDPQWADGYQGTALEFDGGEFVNCGEEAGSGVTADFTFAAWVQMTPGNAGQYMGIGGKLSRLGGNADYMGFALVRFSSNVFRLLVGDGDAANIIGMASSDVTYTDTEWHHVAGVREGQLNMLYVDGVRQAAGNTTGFVPSDLFFQIGRQYSNTTTQRLFKGKIDDVRLYNKALTDAQIADVMLGDTKVAGSPVPGRDALADTRDISSLSWSRGDTAASHDVYFGTDRDAVAGADNSAPEFQGNQAGTSLSLANLVEFGGGDFYWRIDELEADGTVNTGTIWMFTVPDYLIVDNFESYDNIDPAPGEPGINRIFDKWIDGFGTLTNGALVGNDLPPYAETNIVHGGAQAMIYRYDNAGKTSEATLTLTRGDWTVEGVTKLSLWLRGDSANSADQIYVALNGSAVVYHDDPAATQLTGWKEWVIDLATFGIDLANVNSISIGIGTRNAPAPTGGTGTMYFDDIGLIQ